MSLLSFYCLEFVSKNSKDMAPEETTYFPILDFNLLPNFLDAHLYILLFRSYTSLWKSGLTRMSPGSLSLRPKENVYIYGLS